MLRAPDRPWRPPEKIQRISALPRHLDAFATKIGEFFGHGFTGDSTTQEENRK